MVCPKLIPFITIKAAFAKRKKKHGAGECAMKTENYHR